MLENGKFVKEGIIYQAVSGFYYVWSDEDRFVTKPKGNFRHTNQKPLVGDRVVFESDPQDDSGVGRMIEILPRRNALVRPSVANVDVALIVTSLVEPDFSYNLLDYFLVAMEAHHIRPVILLTKKDLLDQAKGQAGSQQLINEITATYQTIGYQVFVFDQTQDKIAALKSLFKKGIYVLTGQSGVGKSTLLNQLLPDAAIATGEISNALNRGRHTTREVTLYQYGEGLLADTPGFSAIEFNQLEKEELASCFPEIHAASIGCRFRSCIHENEPNCQVKEDVLGGKISQRRYLNYLEILERIKQRKKIY